MFQGTAMRAMKNLMKFGAVMSAFAITGTGFAGDVGGTYSIELNKTELLRLSEPASAIIIGNPKIADISVHASDTLFVLGRGYGQTNLIILNARGETIINADIQVVSPASAGNVRLFSGQERATYSCVPNCLPAPVIGDSVEFIVLNTPDTPQINTTTIAAPTASPQNIVGLAVESEPDLVDEDPRQPYYPE